MARKKLSEFAAKKLLYDFLGLTYRGISYDVDIDTAQKIDDFTVVSKEYVLKVDEGVKKRFKQGLIKLGVDTKGIIDGIEEFQKKGFRNFIIEEYVVHAPEEERYLAFERTELGILCYFSTKGGVDIESFENEVEKVLLSSFEAEQEIAKKLEIDEEVFSKLVEAFDIFYFSFLEINPLLVIDNKLTFLDVASEVDSTADFFVEGWTSQDFRDHAAFKKTDEEKEVEELAAKSQAAFALNVLNPDGQFFMLLSGGGASIVLADELFNIGKGELLANYGEYSGNPNEEETYLYTKNVLSLLLKSKAKNKALIIAGGVANFTDVRITFKGIIKALSEACEDLKKQEVGIFVRRGGPHQKEGLLMMEKFLKDAKISGEVHGPELILTEIITRAI
ncbi:MAG: ATP citrate lyase citrate-binding domain-containing protein [Sulfurimonas sp.]|nr:ATP citrate lyase citrate-binding domain-containing protein [Sulfurimonas sp.]